MQLFPFQKEGVNLIEKKFRGRVLLADSMGLGKTLQAVTWIKKKQNSLPAIIICPASVKSGWEDAFKSLVGIHPIVLEGETPR